MDDKSEEECCCLSLIQGGITKLKDFLEGLSEQDFNAEDCSKLYTAIYNKCTENGCTENDEDSQLLYIMYQESLENYLNTTVLPLVREQHDVFMLRELARCWDKYNVMVRWLSKSFSYLERYFIPEMSLPTLSQVGLESFRDLVYAKIKNNVTDAVMKLIECEREGQQIDRTLLKNVLCIFVEIGIGSMKAYQNDFESPMLRDTSAFYSRKAASWIVEDPCPDYMLKAERCLKREKERVGHYLHASSEQKLLERVQQELLCQYKHQLLEEEYSGYHALLSSDDKVDDLSRMYRLFCGVPKGLETIAAIFCKHVKEKGRALVKPVDDGASNKAEQKDFARLQVQWVWRVIAIHDKYLQYVSKCFVNHSLFHKALKEAFEVICNEPFYGSTSAELLASFCDNMLKRSRDNKLNDEAIEDTLEKVVGLLAHVSDKDLFAEFYRKRLARRLLFDKNANDDRERSILTKLKQQYGGQFTRKMEGMVLDLTVAREKQTSFEEYLSSNMVSSPAIDFSVTVLTAGFWPSYKSSGLALPSEMAKCVEKFKDFYLTRTKHRKLMWIFSLGTCNIIGNFDSKRIELVVATYQAAVLLLFNASEKLSYSDIREQLNLIDKDVVRSLHSLSCAKYKILNKEPNTKSVGQNDIFEFNTKFTDKMRQIKIPLPTVDEEKAVIEDVVTDRCYAIDASIVRIMKSRRILPYQKLALECVEQLARIFKPDFKLIKKRIDALIETEYLERDKDNPNVLKYLV